MINAVYQIKELLNLPLDFDKENDEITRKLTRENCVRYAIFAAEEMLPIFEKKYPNIKIPREAIDATKEWLKNPTEENKRKCQISGDKAHRARESLFAYFLAYTTFSSLYAPNSAYSAFHSSYVAFDTPTTQGDTDKKQLQYKIIDYGRKLLKEQT